MLQSNTLFDTFKIAKAQTIWTLHERPIQDYNSLKPFFLISRCETVPKRVLGFIMQKKECEKGIALYRFFSYP